ncbi:hypothetical protein KY289_030675 [Solanum tuberosum]|nr:hypothetical protein KY289_030675 [Solanum tuberosum]
MEQIYDDKPSGKEQARGITNHAYADGDGFGHMDAGHGLMHSGVGLGTTDGSGSSRASNDPLQTRQGGLDSMDNMNMANTNTAGPLQWRGEGD